MAVAPDSNRILFFIYSAYNFSTRIFEAVFNFRMYYSTLPGVCQDDKVLEFPQRVTIEGNQQHRSAGGLSKRYGKGHKVNNYHIRKTTPRPHWKLQCSQLRDMEGWKVLSEERKLFVFWSKRFEPVFDSCLCILQKAGYAPRKTVIIETDSQTQGIGLG